MLRKSFGKKRHCMVFWDCRVCVDHEESNLPLHLFTLIDSFNSMRNQPLVISETNAINLHAGNHYCHREHGADAANQNSYHYSKT